MADTRKLSSWLLLAILCAASMWIYASRVLIPYQISDAAAHDRPRGNLSDLYPRWLGARELLLHGRDPYSPEITREAQIGFFGRPPDPERPGGRNYQQGFYYPVYVAFLLAPTVHLSFEMVRKGFFWVLLGLTVASIPLWLRALRWPAPLWVQVSLVIFTIGSLPVMQGLKLQQMTLLVAALMAIALALLVSERPIGAGVALALATIKPQLVWLLLFWLMIWTLADWRRRYRWAASFLVSMAILCAASEWYLPHWISRFWQAIREYRSYTGEMSVMDELMGAPWSRALEFLAFALMAGACWRDRREAANTSAFAGTISLVLAITVLIVPTYGPYNQALLIPAVLMMLKEGRAIWQRSVADRVLSAFTAGLIVWPWIASIALAGLSFLLQPERVERGWAVPFWTVLQIPMAMAALMLVHQYQRSFSAPSGPGPS
ncbi:MAG: glycosyltransferase family 87 protein [Terriglobales bacterium]